MAGSGTLRAVTASVTGPETTGALLVPVTVNVTEAGVFAIPSLTPYWTVTVMAWPTARNRYAAFDGSMEKLFVAASKPTPAGRIVGSKGRIGGGGAAGVSFTPVLLRFSSPTTAGGGAATTVSVAP